MSQSQANPTWDPEHYAEHGRFISTYGLELIGWLDPKPGERILDLGCGDGFLTEHIAACGADVLGADHDPRMVAGTHDRGLNAVQIDGANLPFQSEFDAVFSNSVLQWVKNPQPVIAATARALKPGGRLIVDVAGLGNLGAVLVAMRAVSDELGGDPELAFPFYAPTEAEFCTLLEENGFVIVRRETSPRFTALPSELWNWIGSIFAPFFSQFDEPTNALAKARVLGLLEPVLRDASGQWHIDHVRVRVEAKLAA